MVDTELLCTMWLTSVFGYGSKKPAQLIEEFGSAYNVFENGRDSLYFGCMSENILSAFENKNLSYAEFILERCRKEGIKTVCIQEESYPELLREIPNPPAVLYYKGNLDMLHKMPFAVIGTRKADDEGRKLVKDFVPQLQNAGFSIVSGFAEGIESYIHKNFNPTVTVLPHGMNICYPSCNAGLKEKIVENGGLVITEFMHDVRAFKGNYHLRNRLLAGMTKGVLIIEASHKSGTSITASAAGDYGRDVYIVPGSVYNPRFAGSHEMLRQNMILVTEPNHIITDFDNCPEIKQPLINDNSQISGVVNLNDSKYDGLSEDEKAVLKCINGNRVHADEITVRTGIDIASVNAILISLTLEGFIEKLDGNQYIIQ
ncbi:MAG: DNA-processing protein DprA [Clostridia bacterium]|nr:DNA-processing protein DprA [Clostridia bacterium]